MASADKTPRPKPGERDEPIKIDLPFETAIDGFLKVDPDSDPAPDAPQPDDD